jgi:hypothetical protein
VSADYPYADRKKLTFEQAEGAEPLPMQLKLGELSPLLRSAIWAVAYAHMRVSQEKGELDDFWENVTYDWHVYRKHQPADEHKASFTYWSGVFKKIVLHDSYTDVFGLLQHILRFSRAQQIAYRTPAHFISGISSALNIGHAAYRVLDGDTIVPIGSDAEAETIQHAFVDLAKTEFRGAREHLRKAAEELSAGRAADSIRESIHAVESVVRVLEPDGNFLRALRRLEAKAKIHPALKDGFKSIYGFTSDEKGIRHPLLDDSSANVDETDALFMIGACAAFVSYLINKARAAGLLVKG